MRANEGEGGKTMLCELVNASRVFLLKMAFDHTHEILELFTYLHDCKALEHLWNETLSDSHSRLRCRAVQ